MGFGERGKLRALYADIGAAAMDAGCHAVARHATRFPSNWPTTSASEGSPKGVFLRTSRAFARPGMVYNPLPPITPMRTGSEAAPRDFFLGFDCAMYESTQLAELEIEPNGFQNVLSTLFAQITRGRCRFVTENHKPSFARRLGDPFLFVFKRRERIQIVTHDPGIRQMRRRGDQISREEGGLASTGQEHAHHVAIVARRADEFDAGNHLGVSLEQRPLA